MNAVRSPGPSAQAAILQLPLLPHDVLHKFPEIRSGHREPRPPDEAPTGAVSPTATPKADGGNRARQTDKRRARGGSASAVLHHIPGRKRTDMVWDFTSSEKTKTTANRVSFE